MSCTCWLATPSSFSLQPSCSSSCSLPSRSAASWSFSPSSVAAAAALRTPLACLARSPRSSPWRGRGWCGTQGLARRGGWCSPRTSPGSEASRPFHKGVSDDVLVVEIGLNLALLLDHVIPGLLHLPAQLGDDGVQLYDSLLIALKLGLPPAVLLLAPGPLHAPV